MFKTKLILISIVLLSSFSSAETYKTNTHKIHTIATGLGVPWGMALLNNYKLIFTQRNGKVRIINLISKKISNIKGLPLIYVKGQGGLLDLALAPNYQTTPWIYFTYSKPQRQFAVTTLARAKLKHHTLTNWQDLFISKSASNHNVHFGSRIAFDNNGHVFFTIGDRGERANAQNLKNHAGSVLRLNLDGSIPNDNPFVGDKNKLSAIWSYGHRNPQGISYDQQHQRLWLIEHGPRGGDEINLILPGRNYGWPVISYGKEYYSPFFVGEARDKAGMQQPIKQYTPSIAPSSLLYYSGNEFPHWRGNLLAGALKLHHLNRISIDKNLKVIAEHRLLENLNERIRNVIQDDNGVLYLATDNGKILKITTK